MRIAIIAGPYVPVPPEKYGGTELVIHFLIKGLLEAGHTPILLGSGNSRVDCELIPIIEKSVFYPKRKSGLPAFNKITKQVEKTTKKELRKLLPNIDIIHSHGFDLLPFSAYPTLTTLHGPINFDQIDYLLKRKTLPYAAISKNQMISMPDLNFVDVVYNGEDPNDFPIVTEPEDYVCFLGRFDREKNPHLAIQLALSLGIKIKLAGKIDFLSEGYFEEEIKKYFDHPLVEFLGEIGLKEKVELLGKAKCNLHPTNFREPFGLTVLEAAYCGTPTLATSRGSMSEVIEPGKTGFLVEDFIEGRYQLEKCFALDREYIASRSRRLFNYRTMADQYIKTYEKVIGQFSKSNRLMLLWQAFMHRFFYRTKGR